MESLEAAVKNAGRILEDGREQVKAAWAQWRARYGVVLKGNGINKIRAGNDAKRRALLL